MQNHLVPKLPSSIGYKNLATVMDVCPSYLFAYHTAGQEAKSNILVISKIKKKHAYLPNSSNSDKGSVFVSQVPKQAEQTTDAQKIILEKATTKHAETIGMVERTIASLKKALKFETGERNQFGLSMTTLPPQIATSPTTQATQALVTNLVEFPTDMPRKMSLT